MDKVIIGFSRQERCDMVKELVVSNGFMDVATATSGAEVLRYASMSSGGILVCGMKFRDMLYSDIYEAMPDGFGLLVLLTGSQAAYFDDEDVFQIVLPVNKHDLIKTMHMVLEIGRKGAGKRLTPRDDAGKIVRSDAERRIVEKAKLLLMNKYKISEESAHRFIQKKSMDYGIKLVETAKMILED